MFNTKSWSKLTEQTYGYKSKVICNNNFELHFTHVINEIGEYFISPSFGDYVDVTKENLRFIDEWAEKNNNKPIRLKISIESIPQLKYLEFEPSGYIHKIEYNSYEFWNKEIIKCKFRNQINQANKNDLTTKILNKKENLREFWKMHATLRLNKFGEIPQPWDYFENIYAEYFSNNKGFIIHAFDKKNNLVGGVLFLIIDNIAYYKFSASYKSALSLRPNNLIMDRLIYFLNNKGIQSLNLGYTGSSLNYSGLRKFKLHSGANEYPRYILKTPSFDSLERSEKIKSINNKIQLFIRGNPTIDEVDEFSQKYYKYFI